MSTPKRKRRLLITGIATLAAAVTVGLAAPSVLAESPDDGSRDHKANAELLDAKCDVPPNHDPAIIQQIHDIGTSRGVNEKVMLAMFEAGWVESHVNNLNCGDKDSLGVFQQRPSQGWCDPADLCLDVNHATNAFLDQAIPNDQNNPGFTAGELAQSVQRSAYPERYDQSEGKARELIAEAANT
ncbi:hypothetical protein [Stackebrandtia nassauensis]|uniref:Secreted protein n=1 Tax=Stackebrandtia nassauensis (strain DSM 44728 / CIP 108903 / NRRL B-16338 / NBRC 102104 / LLR-40K-21) TaxID=446470 RepID=D3Q8B0_STANL|nr:hypothetical protein [Stackebrandtia nassauensis]ADD42484.1 hypothetical protein Snas_2808 [Stackebrandtia nassauensis DSM 44728]